MYPHLEARQFFVFVTISLAFGAYTTASAQQNSSAVIPYLRLSVPRHILSDAQPWEGDQFPHTLSVVELNRNGYRYWGWYGLNGGRGIGLAMSNDLLDWVKYENNPLLTNARWPTVLVHADQQDPDLLYVAFTRDYETPTSYIMLGSTSDGIHIKERRFSWSQYQISEIRIRTYFMILPVAVFILRGIGETIRISSRLSAGVQPRSEISTRHWRRY